VCVWEREREREREREIVRSFIVPETINYLVVSFIRYMLANFWTISFNAVCQGNLNLLFSPVCTLNYISNKVYQPTVTWLQFKWRCLSYKHLHLQRKHSLPTTELNWERMCVCRVGANYSDIDFNTAKKNKNCLLALIKRFVGKWRTRSQWGVCV
jgi:hypothetical protein